MRAITVWISALGAVVALSGCSSDSQVAAGTQQEPPAALEIRSAQIAERQVDRAIEVVGSLEPREKVDLSFEVAGRLDSIAVDFGNQVSKGSIIARLDPAEFKFRVERTEAALAQALAQIGLPPDGNPDALQTTPAIEQVRAQLEDAESKFESAKSLIESGDISRNRYIELEKTYEARKASVQAAEDQLRQLKAQIQALRADLNLAKRDLDETVLRAPFSGEILRRLVSRGQFLKENTPVATLVQTRPLRLRALVPESAAGHIASGQEIEFRTDALPDKSFHGIVEEISPSLDTQARTLEVEARVREDDPRLRPGMFVKVSIVVDRQATVLMVPREAVYEIAGLKKVFTIEDGKAVERRVRTGIEQDGWVEIIGDFASPGIPVAISDLDELQDGRAVTLRG